MIDDDKTFTIQIVSVTYVSEMMNNLYRCIESERQREREREGKRIYHHEN